MKNLIYRLIIFLFILGIGLSIFYFYQDRIYIQDYSFDYVEDEVEEYAVNDEQWLKPVEIEKPGYYIIEIEPWHDSLNNQTYHILELLDKNDNLITRMEDALYIETTTVSEGSPENLRNCKWDTNCHDHTTAKYREKKLVKIENPGEYSLWYTGIKQLDNLESEHVNFFIYKKLNPVLLGIPTLILAVLASIFVPKILSLERISKIFKRK